MKLYSAKHCVLDICLVWRRGWLQKRRNVLSLIIIYQSSDLCFSKCTQCIVVGTLANLTRNPDLAGFVILDLGLHRGACVLFVNHDTTRH